MRYVPSQVREALDITEETLRHWRKVFSPLHGKRGYGGCFTPGDVLALKVIACLRDLGMEVRQMKPFAVELFAACSRGLWESMENKVLVLDGSALEIVASGQEARWADQARIVVPLKPLIVQLRQSVSEERTRPAQPEIVFPPVGVIQGRSR